MLYCHLTIIVVRFDGEETGFQLDLRSGSPESRRENRKEISLFNSKEIERQFRYQPEVETKNRKPLLKPSSLGPAWELRFGPENRFRVLYKTDHELRTVNVLAIGVKIKERLYIGGKEFEL